MRTIRTLLVIAVLVGSTSLWAAGGDLPGSGTEGDPYLIEDLADFDRFAGDPNYWDDYTRLETDIDLDDGRPPYTTAVIAPDGDNTNYDFNGIPFEGIFDGDGHVISNLTIDTAGAGNDYLGLFGQIEGSSAEVKNLGMENVNIIGGDDSYYLGGLCGYNYLGTITNCYSSGSVIGDDSLGGLCGENRGGTITNCYATGPVSGASSVGIGGLCGGNWDGTITNCYATGSVTGGDHSQALGGLCGENRGTITNCYATGSVTGGDDYLGGLCGENTGTITNCYATGSVIGRVWLGGLCGYNRGPITNCYATGSVSGYWPHSWWGGLCGTNGNTITNCFWDIETSGMTDGVGNQHPDPAGATGKTTAQMQTLTTFTDAGWDFTNESTNGIADVWRLCVDGTDYPRLACEFGSDYSCPDGVSIEDLLYLSTYWLETGLAPYTSADRTGDGLVNLKEHALLAQQWMSQ